MTKLKGFTQEFEDEAVRPARTSGRTRRETTENLGVGLSTLTRWIARSRDREIDVPDKGRTEDAAAELKRLRRENTILRQDRDILKKAAGSQYCSVDYQAELRRHRVRISMSGKGNCYDNAMVKTFFKTLKSELVWQITFFTRADATRDIARYIDGFYNPGRRNSALDYLSPAQFEKRAVS